MKYHIYIYLLKHKSQRKVPKTKVHHQPFHLPHCYPCTMSKSVAGGAIRSRYVAGHSPSAASPSSKAKNNPCFASHLLLDIDPRHSPDGGALGVAN